jgi:hypothetical protein
MRMLRTAAVLCLILLTSCGGLSPEERLLGKWAATDTVYVVEIEILEDGTFIAFNEDVLEWELIGRNGTEVLIVTDPETGETEAELTFAFEGDDIVVFHNLGTGQDVRMVRKDD